MVESERTRVLYRRVNMFYIPLLSVIHWRAADDPIPAAAPATLREGCLALGNAEL